MRTVIAAIGGGGLITGVGSAIKALRPDVKVLGAEPETAAPYAYSLREAGRANFPIGRRRSSTAPAGKASPSACGSGCSRWSTARSPCRSIRSREAMRLMAEKARVIAEGAGALALAAALTGEAGEGPIVCVVSGGNIDLEKFAELVADQRPVNSAGRFSRKAATPSR